jgi:hypothetical protein
MIQENSPLFSDHKYVFFFCVHELDDAERRSKDCFVVEKLGAAFTHANGNNEVAKRLQIVAPTLASTSPV